MVGVSGGTECGAAADVFVVAVLVVVAVAETRITAAKASSGSVGLGRTFTASIARGCTW